MIYCLHLTKYGTFGLHTICRRNLTSHYLIFLDRACNVWVLPLWALFSRFPFFSPTTFACQFFFLSFPPHVHLFLLFSYFLLLYFIFASSSQPTSIPPCPLVAHKEFFYLPNYIICNFWDVPRMVTSRPMTCIFMLNEGLARPFPYNVNLK